MRIGVPQLIGCLSLAASAIVRADLPAPQKMTTVEGITEHRLGNGLQVLLFPDASKETVTVNVTYLVGSRHEGYGETGMAHLLEHMVFKGTPDHPQIWKALQDHGANFNGTTSYDRTNYFETLAASDENLEFALKMEADRMVNSFIAKKDLDSEFSVVRNEFEMGENSPLGVLSERVVSTAYLWHNYGKSTIGSREDIERVPIERLQAFYKKYYQPDNAMLVVAGKFDEGKTLTRVNEIFGTIPRPTRVLDKTYTAEPAQDGQREVTLRRVGDVQAIDVVYHVCAEAHEDAAPLDVLAHTLTADQTGRLYKALIETQLATRVSADAATLYDPGYFEVSAQLRLDQPLDKVRTVLLDVVENLHKTPFTAEEVDRAKNAFAKRFDLAMNDSGRVGIRISESAAAGDWRLMFLKRDRMKQVTPADVQRVAALYFKPSNRTLGTFIPTKDTERTIVPPAPDVLALLSDYAGSDTIAKGEPFEATIANIESRTQRTKTTSGLKLALLPKKTRGERVNVQMLFHYGSEADLKGRTDAAAMIATMIPAGTTEHSRRQIQDTFDKLKANVFFSGGGLGGGRRNFTGAGAAAPGTLAVSIETTRPNLPAVMELVGEMLRQPAFPETEFEKERKETLAMLEQGLSEPMMLAPNAMRRRLAPYGPDDVRYVATIDERIERTKNLKLDDVKKAYKELLGADRAEIAAVGDFDPAELTSSVEQALTGWKAKKPFERVALPFKEAKPEKVEINTPDKANSLFTMGMNIGVRDDDPDYAALVMANYILGGSSSSRLTNRIRQKEGLSYGVRSNLMVSSHEPSGSFSAGGICAPQNAAKALACAREEIDRLLNDGVTQQELDDARKGYLEDLKVGLTEDSGVAGTLARDLFLDRTMKFTEQRVARIKALTPADLQTVAKKYIDPNKFVVVSAGDFATKATEAKPTPATD